MGKRRTNGEGTVFERPDRPGTFRAFFSWYDDTTGESGRKPFDAKSKSAALAKGRKWLKEREAGLKHDKKKLTVSEWLDIWLETYKKKSLSYKSYEKYVSSLKYVRGPFGTKYLSKVEACEFQDFLDELLECGGVGGKELSADTVTNVRKYFKAAMSKAVKLGYITKNVIDDTDPPESIDKEYEVLEPEDIAKILEVAKKYDKMTYTLIEFAAKTGCRRGEVFGLKWHRINIEKGTAYFSNALVSTNHGQLWTSPKTKSSKRIINLPEDVVKSLKEYKVLQQKCREKAGEKWEEDDIVFTNKTGGFMQMSNFMSRVFKQILIEADFNPEKIHFHTLRHSLASVLIENGVSPKEVQALLGHKSVLTTLRIYSHRINANKDLAKKATDNLYAPNIGVNKETATQTVTQTRIYSFCNSSEKAENGSNTCEESFEDYKYASAF